MGKKNKDNTTNNQVTKCNSRVVCAWLIARVRALASRYLTRVVNLHGALKASLWSFSEMATGFTSNQRHVPKPTHHRGVSVASTPILPRFGPSAAAVVSTNSLPREVRSEARNRARF